MVTTSQYGNHIVHPSPHLSWGKPCGCGYHIMIDVMLDTFDFFRTELDRVELVRAGTAMWLPYHDVVTMLGDFEASTLGTELEQAEHSELGITIYSGYHITMWLPCVVSLFFALNWTKFSTPSWDKQCGYHNMM